MSPRARLVDVGVQTAGGTSICLILLSIPNTTAKTSRNPSLGLATPTKLRFARKRFQILVSEGCSRRTWGQPCAITESRYALLVPVTKLQWIQSYPCSQWRPWLALVLHKPLGDIWRAQRQLITLPHSTPTGQIGRRNHPQTGRSYRHQSIRHTDLVSI